jgi:hypothetical protein
MASLAIHPPPGAGTAASFNDHNQGGDTSPPIHNSNVVVFEQTINVDEDVIDFFDTRFKSREDLANIKSVLQEQIAIGDELNHKVTCFITHAVVLYSSRHAAEINY